MILREYKKINNIFVFDDDVCEKYPDYYADGLDGHIKKENEHFWFMARREFLLGRLNKYINKKSRGIDIGAGTGNVTGYLISNGYENLCVGEMHRNGLEYARQYGSKELYQFNILKVTFDEEFDFVCLFDLLEHVEDEDTLLRNVHRMLRGEKGKLIITVPAHQWLWSLYDKAAHHKRRYTKKYLKEKLVKNGFEVLEMRYFFIFITPFLFLRIILKPDRATDYTGYRAEDSINSRFINKILLWLCRIENKMIDSIPNFCGGSLCVVARVINSNKLLP